mgnify:CR=1 FL=1
MKEQKYAVFCPKDRHASATAQSAFDKYFGLMYVLKKHINGIKVNKDTVIKAQ